VIRLGLIGGRGYVGAELLRLLANSPNYEVVFAGSRSAAGTAVSDECPGFLSSLRFATPDAANLRAARVDAWILALDNGQAAPFVAEIDSASCRIVDVSADFRFDSDWVYGLPQMNRDEIAGASRITNPGCYATAVQLALLPMRDWLESGTPPVAFGVSGYSGAGRTPGPRNDPQRLCDNLMPYQLTGHGHELESSHHLGMSVRLVPHVAGFFRGLSVTVTTTCNRETEPSGIADHFRKWYANWPLVKVTEGVPEIADVRETNRAVIGGFAVDRRDARRVALVCVLDNLRKGAASQVIENLNLMFRLAPEAGLQP
jgi:N-acetyl-gamma-glutamyl-phosphate reductase